MNLYLATFCFDRVTNAEGVAAGLRKKSIQHFRMNRESWLIYTSQDVGIVCNLLKSLVSSSDELLVTPLQFPFAARLGDGADRWVRNRLPLAVSEGEAVSLKLVV